MSLPYTTMDVFTEHAYGGNPLAVFNDAPELSTAQMQAIAGELNLSETVFIGKPRDPRAYRRLRIFTPRRELPFAGHPTIGAAYLLAQHGAPGNYALEEEVGLVPIRTQREAGKPVHLECTTARVPEFIPGAPDLASVARLLRLDERDFPTEDNQPETWSVGVPYTFVPVRNREVLTRVRPSPDTPEVFVFCRDPELPGSSVRGRMFAPAFGISEDPATGSAAGALAGYLARREARGDGTLRWILEQGFEMGRPSLLHIEADVQKGAVSAVRLGGTAVIIARGELLAIPP